MAADDGFSDGAVQRLISALPSEQRETLTLVCVDNLTYQEAAERLGVTQEEVIARLLEARRRIIEIFDDAAAQR